MNSLGPHSFDKLISPRAVPRDEGTHAFASEIQNLTRIFRLELFKLREDVRADLTGMLYKVKAVYFVVDSIEEKYSCGIADPSIISGNVNDED